MAEIILTVTNRAISLPQTVPQQIAETEYIDKVKFNCDSEYDGYTLVAVFKNGEHGKTFPVTVPADRSAVDIDPRALRRAGLLYIGMFGVDGLKTLPTLWASAIEIKDGTDVGAEADAEETPALVARVTALETAVDSLSDTVDDLSDTVEALAEEVVTLDNAVDELTDTVEGLADDVEELTETVEGKQDTIPDLATIRSGAALGATALQSVPTPTDTTIGGVKKGNPSLGLYLNNSQQFVIQRATDTEISGRSNNYKPITPANMDAAFRTCITEPAQELTDNQKEEACATIGAVSHFDGFRKIIDYTTTDNETNVITFTNDDEGEPISLQYEDIIIKTDFPHGTASGDVRVFTRETDTSRNPANMLLYYSSGYMVHVSDNRYTMAYIKNVWRGAWTTIKQTYASSITQYTANTCSPSNAFCEIDGEMIRRFRFVLATSAGAFPSGGKIEIYVK